MKKKQSHVFAFAAAEKKKYVTSVLLALAGTLFAILPYAVMAGIITRLLAGNKDLHGYLISCLWLALFWLARAALHAGSTRLSHQATFAVLGKLRKGCLDKLSRVPLGAVKSRPSGELKNTLVERIDSIETTLAHILPEFTSNLTCSLCVLICLFFVDWRMALAALIPIPLGFLCMMGMMAGYEKSWKRCVDGTKALNDSAVEYIGGIEVIKVFGKVKSSYERFQAAAQESAHSYIDWMRRSNFFFCFCLVVTPATMVSVLPIGGLLMRAGTLTAENFILVTLLALGLVGPLIVCMSYSDDLAKLSTVLGEVDAILDEEDLVRPAQDEAVPKDNTVVFENVHFGYGEKEVLHGVNLRFEEGKVSALVGPSGSGKSTIAKLLAAYWDVEEGSVSIGGVDIRRLSQESYYKRIAYVSQENFLFDDTVMENIRMGRPGASDEAVIEAAKRCGCHDFIMALEDGYNTVVGGAGGHLSGGERQRIAIARAMLKDAPIVVLDEATSYTDPENEALIQESVAKLVAGKTLIVIAHRLSTIADADCIYVIHDGQVEEQGTHDVLLKKNGLYKRMWVSHIESRDMPEGGEAHV